jgi:hypothetical protein
MMLAAGHGWRFTAGDGAIVALLIAIGGWIATARTARRTARDQREAAERALEASHRHALEERAFDRRMDTVFDVFRMIRGWARFGR